ncbi:MAG: ribosome biogenesis GTP-binding protein [Candidatus Desulfovibrio kirbyi]|jgi:GTP-binding protein|uniref:Probable GTP-binding protein EngB n=1 Tax=Candidatus Desulfovibrio kirbyi TaxID=2696086 RepID=A0A6L2R4Y6_9BACT|nr:ribosome biogenesis GTP-binding protein YihA/YsxC [Desulfovibrio sp.]GFH62565.1 MAG: ribosome biogenesis GTP-binding protein [Candidatus Desulfovibrio kirbyi]
MNLIFSAKTALLSRHISLELATTAYTADQLPELCGAQIALAGRSNVGKSSLINALAGRKKLAKVSATPGKTRSVNFYCVSPYNFYLVDLPGYGYARAGRNEKRQWGLLLEAYLTRAVPPAALVLLLDCRLPPQRPDLRLFAFARDMRFSLLGILTKADKCTQKEIAHRQKEWSDLLGKKPLVTSSEKRFGITDLWQCLVDASGTNLPQDA